METQFLLVIEGKWCVTPGILDKSFELRPNSIGWRTCKTKQAAEDMRKSLPECMQQATKIVVRKIVQKEIR